MNKYILTVGPSLLNTPPITKIHDGKHIYRINGAHGSIEDIENMIAKIRGQVKDSDILMDLPGNKIRTKNIGKIELLSGEKFSIPSRSFNFEEFYKYLTPGMSVWANDSIFEFEVISADEDKIVFLSKSTGTLIDNKGVHVRDIHHGLPFLFEKDRQLIEIANRYQLSYVGLSFVRRKDDIEQAKALLSNNIKIISKVETLEAVKNLNDILSCVDYILIDRGDLSTEIGIENIPHYQNYIIEKALYFDVKVFLATQILKNMEDKPLPTIAEIDDLYSIAKKGVYGVQLSEETAVGQYVEECVNILNKVSANIVKESIVYQQ